MRVNKVKLIEDKESICKGYNTNPVHVAFTGTSYISEDTDTVALSSYINEETFIEKVGKWLISITNLFSKE